jgi:hypothetical protein
MSGLRVDLWTARLLNLGVPAAADFSGSPERGFLTLPALRRPFAAYEKELSSRLARRRGAQPSATLPPAGGTPRPRPDVGHTIRGAWEPSTSSTGGQRQAIVTKIYRLLAYQRCMERAEEMGNLVLVGEMCERAAKEVGGVYTNKREMSGPSGSPIAVTAAVVEVPQMAKDMEDWVARYTPKSVHDEACEPTAS